MVGITPGIYNTNSDSLRITIYGKGGHGAMPHTTMDPIVIAARTILSLQTIASREVKPGEMAVVTVGYIRAGTKNNIIPDQAEMGLTVRTYKPEVRKQILAAITRITKAEAAAGGRRASLRSSAMKGPTRCTTIRRWPSGLGAAGSALGKDNVVTAEPITPSEDFSYFVEQGVPGFYFSLGGADPQKFAEAKAAGTSLPSNHSPCSRRMSILRCTRESSRRSGGAAESTECCDFSQRKLRKLNRYTATVTDVSVRVTGR